MNLWLTVLLNLCLMQTAFAEPTNIEVLRQELLSYHNNGMYLAELREVTDKAKIHLGNVNLHPFQVQRPAIVFDIDETVLSNFEDLEELRFGGTMAEIRRRESLGRSKAIKPSKELYDLARANNLTIFFITGRPEVQRAITIKNLRSQGFTGWHKLIMKSNAIRISTGMQANAASNAPFKTKARADIEQQGYRIVASIGDQWSDLEGGHAEKTFKLPNPFYFIP